MSRQITSPLIELIYADAEGFHVNGDERRIVIAAEPIAGPVVIHGIHIPSSYRDWLPVFQEQAPSGARAFAMGDKSGDAVPAGNVYTGNEAVDIAIQYYAISEGTWQWASTLPRDDYKLGGLF